jgi:hypothetical protein
MGKLELKQVLTINNDGNKEFISTGATLNNIEYISLPTILGMYDKTDPTIRKYLKKNGQKEVDYFLSDGKLFISSNFLSKNAFYPKKENISTFHPYRKTRIKGCVIPYSIIDDDSKNCSTIRGKISKELNKINWDYFIHINTIKYISSDDWDVIMDRFINLLSNHLGSKNVFAAYSKERSIKEVIVKNKYEFNHCHAHILVHRDSKFIRLDTIKSLFLQSMNKRRFYKKEFMLKMYDRSQDGIGYLLKEYNVQESNFSMIYPVRY